MARLPFTTNAGNLPSWPTSQREKPLATTIQLTKEGGAHERSNSIGDDLANSLSPVHGVDSSDPIAAVNSIAEEAGGFGGAGDLHAWP